MSSRIPSEAFDFYVGLGATRSYQAVARKYGVSKRAVTKHAKRAEWPSRLEKVEATAREKADKRLAETLEEMRERHLKMLRLMAGRALEGLTRYPANSTMECARIADMTIKLERIIAGEPANRTAVSVEDVIKREYERWMVVAGEEDVDGSDSGAA